MYSLLEECQINERAIDALPYIVAALESAVKHYEAKGAPLDEALAWAADASAALKKGGF